MMFRKLPYFLLPAATLLLPAQEDPSTGTAPEAAAPPGALPAPVGGAIPDEEREELRKPLTLFVEGGRQFTGTLAGFDGEKLSLRTVQAGGEIILSFPKEEIRRIFFPGGSILEATRQSIERGDLPGALPYMEALLALRFPVFPLLPHEQRSLYASVPMAALAIDRPAAAIAYVDALRPYLTGEADRTKLRTAELLARYILRLDDAREQASAWIADAPLFSESALGYFVLAAIHFENGAFEDALYTALQPMVFSGQIPVAYLPHCYSLAIASTHILGNDLHREQLLAEMRERNLPWQPLRSLGTARDDLRDLVVEDADGNPLPLFEATTGDERLLESMDDTVGTGNFVDPSQLIPL